MRVPGRPATAIGNRLGASTPTAWGRRLAAAAVFGCVWGVWGVRAADGGAALAPLPHFPAVARQVVTLLQRGHITQQPFDDTASAQTWTNLLTFLDYDRAYFLQEDIARFEPMRSRIDDALKSGDVAFAYDVFAVFRERLAQRMEFVTNFLAAPIDFSIDESYQWKRKQAPWPATRA